MIRAAALALCLVPVAGGLAAAQADRRAAGPRELCVAHAQASYARIDDTVVEIALDPEDPPRLERSPTARIGSQPVSVVATGIGGLRRADGSTVALRWICVLDDRSRPVFFHAGTEPAPRALAECWRWSANRLAVGDCLAGDLVDAERALEAAERKAAADASSLDAATGRNKARAAQRASDLAWQAYRDTECDRVAELAAGGSGAGDFYRACLIDRTRARAADLIE